MELLVLLLAWIGSAILSGWLAQEKGRPAMLWVGLGALFPGIALLALIGAPPRRYDMTLKAGA